MKKLFIALFVSLMLVGCANNVGDVGPQTKTITVQNSSNCGVQLNGQIIEGSGDSTPHIEEVVLELGKTYDLYILNAESTVLQDYVDCNVDIVGIGPHGQNGISVSKSINGNWASPTIISN
jgi:hypothetical protein